MPQAFAVVRLLFSNGGLHRAFLAMPVTNYCQSWGKRQIIAVPVIQKRLAEASPEPGFKVAPEFTERPAWQAIGDGWRHLHGSVRGAGVSFEWHDFEAHEEFDWGRSFHPGSIEICLNLAGAGRVAFNGLELRLTPLTAGFYRRGEEPLRATRQPHQRHRFLTVEMSFDFLRGHLSEFAAALHPMVGDVVAGTATESTVGSPTRLTSRQQQILVSLREAPVLVSAQKLWYQCKALELAADLFFLPPGDQELFCQRQERIAAERVEQVTALLRRDLSNPPGLEDLGRSVGCSPFHLSRTFSAATGLTIPQYVRQLRMERAAELLRSGRFNVTEAALEVGYSSLSHFSQAFHETFGCCPGLYPLRTPAQKASLKRRRA